MRSESDPAWCCGPIRATCHPILHQRPSPFARAETSTHPHRIANLLQPALEVTHAPHNVLDVVHVRKPNVEDRKELGFVRREGRGSEKLEQVAKVVAAAGRSGSGCQLVSRALSGRDAAPVRTSETTPI